jgi:hypothetical protein
MDSSRPLARVVLLVALILFAVGCVGVAGGGSAQLWGGLVVLAALLTGLTGCVDTFQRDANNREGDGGWELSEDLGPTSDADDDMRDGTWQTCCKGGTISTCFCPTGVACNYGWFARCDASDGGPECALFPEDCGDDLDAGMSDMGAPSDMGRDMTWLDVGTGADMSDGGTAGDAGLPDMGDGTWQTCCQSGEISTCFCPSGVACNYGWFTRCDPDMGATRECALFPEDCYADM